MGVLVKGLLKRPIVQAVIGKVVGLYMAFCGVTQRWRWVDRVAVEPIWAGGKPAIVCVWHNRIMLAHKGWAIGKGGQPVRTVISQSREGEVIAAAAEVIGSGAIRGSSAKGGRQKGGLSALRESLRHLETNGCVCITPDGPRGPRMRAQLGIIQLARLSGAPIVVMGWSSRWRFTLKTWDRFVVALPFSPAVFVWGGPIEVSRTASAGEMEAARQRLEDELTRVTQEADRLCGVSVIQPDPAPGPADYEEAAA